MILPVSSSDDPNSAVAVAQQPTLDNPPSFDRYARTGFSDQPMQLRSILDLDLRQYDLEVLQRAIQLVNAENGAGRMHGTMLVEPPPAYQAGP